MTCIFCNITPDKFKIEYSDDSVSVFHDIRPAGRIHLLVVPKEHCGGIAQLDHHHVDKASVVLICSEAHAPDRHCFGFHLSPFVMIDHLHLHVIVPPTSLAKSWLYASWFPWFLPVDKAIDELKAKDHRLSPTI
ncbi:HIT-like domain-containing protein [Catenaria anguillulae PL171]|uniref:HIT-like domain-containing protein n=1 Tax=Catenaria anguillulae PL171 TaxID=765915 RepID=A0A1Y2HK16_9FUNG|nr:HIT-like domain-containing protein [Catenaria anguillulae PL171]